MNKEKISKFIYSCRKEQKLTQQELADRLYVSSNAISKWERGICLPDVTTFDKVAEVLNVSVAELVAGEKISDNSDKKIYDNILINNIRENYKKMKVKNRIIIFLISFIVFVIITILSVFFYNNYNNITTYSFTGNSENFKFDNGTIVFSRKKGMISISNFKVVDENLLNLENVSDLKITVLFNEKEWASESYNEIEDKDIRNWLANDVFFYEGPSSQCINFDRNCGKGVFDKINKSEFPNNLKIEVDYCLDGEEKKETLEIIALQIASNKIIN